MPAETDSKTPFLSVKTSVYEGPLDLLLELIEKRKLLINDIALASVTDEYLARIKDTKELPIRETAEFITLAATLLLIKSRSLLPSLSLTDEESRDVKELEYRLAVYKLIKEAGRALPFGDVYLHEGRSPEPEPLYVADTSVTPASLRAAAQILIEGFPQTLTLPKVEIKKILSLEEMIQTMASRITSAFNLSFKEFNRAEAPSAQARHHIIVSFLALLELVKQGIIKATQEGDDIRMESDAVGTPRYD